MSINLEAKKHPLRSPVEEQTARQRKVIRTTLGELIVTVTDLVMPFVHDSSELYSVASCVVNDLLAHARVVSSTERLLLYRSWNGHRHHAKNYGRS